MPRAWHPCSTPTCSEVVPPGQSRCDDCRQEAERKRGTAAQRGYGKGHRGFRRGVLARDPYCVCTNCDDHRTPCFKLATEADHYPLSRRELVAQGLDPNDPANGRGLCHQCHSRSTAREQPGGFLDR